MRRLWTCPLGQLQGNGQSCFPYLPREQHAKLTASAGVTDVTGHASPRIHFLDTAQVQESGCRRQRSVEDEEDWGNEKWR
jgi:hypothetical protein